MKKGEPWTPKYYDLKLKALQISSLYKSGLEVAQIAQQLGVNIKTIYRYLKALDISLRKKDRPRHPQTGRYLKIPFAKPK